MAYHSELLQHLNSYLGVLMSFSTYSGYLTYRTSVAIVARKIVGLLYRRYYQYSDPSTLFHLDLSLVRHHTEYAAQVWDPHLLKGINSLQKFARFVVKTGIWDF